MSYTRKQINESKKGYHYVRVHGPWSEPTKTEVVKVRNDLVSVRTLEGPATGQVFTLNRTASQSLMKGEYRV